MFKLAQLLKIFLANQLNLYRTDFRIHSCLYTFQIVENNISLYIFRSNPSTIREYG